MVVAIGCSTPKSAGPRKASNWAYAPVSVNVHPLSRFRIPTVIFVHVELLDGDGFSCRGVGILHVVVSTPRGAIIETKSVKLDDPDINRMRFDEVTRTYRIRIDTLPDDIDRVSVRATFDAIGESPIRSAPRTIENNY